MEISCCSNRSYRDHGSSWYRQVVPPEFVSSESNVRHQDSSSHERRRADVCEGKTTTVVNTAISLAQLGASVLIIDCDLRKPSTHKVLGVDHSRGLSTYLSRNVDIKDVIQKLPIANLSLLPCGPIPPNPSEMISSAKMKQMLQTLSETYDHIIIDSPPLLKVTDPVILSTMVYGVILVVHGGKSTRDIVRRTRQELSIAGARIFGVVLNNVEGGREGYDDYYYEGYSDYKQESAGASGD